MTCTGKVKKRTKTKKQTNDKYKVRFYICETRKRRFVVVITLLQAAGWQRAQYSNLKQITTKKEILVLTVDY